MAGNTGNSMSLVDELIRPSWQSSEPKLFDYLIDYPMDLKENRIDEKVEKKKVIIGKELVKNLIKKYEDTEDDSILKRPIFMVFNKILESASLNYMPTSRKHELINKEAIRKWLSK